MSETDMGSAGGVTLAELNVKVARLHQTNIVLGAVLSVVVVLVPVFLNYIDGRLKQIEQNTVDVAKLQTKVEVVDKNVNRLLGYAERGFFSSHNASLCVELDGGITCQNGYKKLPDTRQGSQQQSPQAVAVRSQRLAYPSQVSYSPDNLLPAVHTQNRQ